MKQKLLLLAAVFFGFLAFILSYRQIQHEREKLQRGSVTEIVIKVTRNMAAGEEITEADIARLEIQRSANLPYAMREIPWSQSASVIGRKLETSVSAGTPLLATDLKALSQRQGFNGIIRPGMRAISIAVDNVGSVSNLVMPNDNVDIIGTFHFPDVKGDASLDTVTLTILQNVKILAVGNRWGNRYLSPDEPRSAYGTVTILVWPEEVEMLIFAAKKGSLSLSLRNFEDSRINRSLEGHSVNFKELERQIPAFNQFRLKKQQAR